MFGEQAGTDFEISFILGAIHAAEEISVEEISLLFALLLLLNRVQFEHSNLFLGSLFLDGRALILLAGRAELVLKAHGRFEHASTMRHLPRKGIIEGDCRLIAVEANGGALLRIQRMVNGCILRHVHFFDCMR